MTIFSKNFGGVWPLWPSLAKPMQRATVEQRARKFRNVSLQTKERTWVNCKLITASHQNGETGSFAVWVPYR